jgi:hypothetical protein
MVLLAIVAHVVSAGLFDTARPDGPVGLLVALDVSGSLRSSFPTMLEKLNLLLDSLPDGSRLALISFDETAEELARTSYLTPQQRETIRVRLRSLKASGDWTNYDVAAEQIKVSYEALYEPLLVVVFTDTVSDPSPGHPFERFDHLLTSKFSGKQNVHVLLVTPSAQEMSDPTESAVTCIPLEDFTPDFITSIFPAIRPVSPRTVRPEVRWRGVMTSAVLLLVATTGWLLLMNRPRARRLAQSQSKKPAKRRFTHHLIARFNGNIFDFGPLEQVTVLHLGTGSGCDVPLIAPEVEQGEIVVRRKSATFRAENHFPCPVKINGRDVRPGRTEQLRLPAHVSVKEKLSVLLMTTPRRVVEEPEKETDKEPVAEVRNGN